MAGKMRFGNPGGLTSLLKDGYKHFSGLEEAIMRNIEACKQLAAITRTSLGPASMNKLVVNHLDRIFVTSDAATIVQELEVAHPAARMLTLAAKMQEQEQGDGTNLVLTFAGELLGQAEGLLRLGVHPSEIIEGYKKAADTAFAALEELAGASGPVPPIADIRDVAALRAALAPVIASKHAGYEGLLAGLVAEAITTTLPPAPRKATVNVDNIRVAKLIGGTASDSQVLRGVVVQRDTEGSIKHVAKAKIAVFGVSIEASSPETRGTVVIRTADELKAYNKGEERLMEEAIKGIAATGAWRPFCG
jgi:T-complex protein 1 subunit theta